VAKRDELVTAGAARSECDAVHTSYARQVAVADVGFAGQAALARARVLIVGLGGLGCPAALFLASSGVGHIVLNDFDEVDETNSPRQILYGPHDVGQSKAIVAARRLRELNPRVQLTCIAWRLNEEKLAAAVASADIVLDASDNFATRFAVNSACVAHGVPLVSGAALGLEGHIAVFPNREGEPCYSCLFGGDDASPSDLGSKGVLTPVPGVIGTLMAQEALKLIFGWESGLHNCLLVWDAKDGGWQRLRLRHDPECVVCGRKSRSSV
jgi:molybdopterin-synthase adenylyltransferase